MPTLSPSIPGQWAVQGDAAVFTPTVGYLENTRVTVNIPGGLAGVMSAAGATAGDGGTLGSNLSPSFAAGSFSTMPCSGCSTSSGTCPMTWTPESHPGHQPGQRQGRALRRL